MVKCSASRARLVLAWAAANRLWVVTALISGVTMRVSVWPPPSRWLCMAAAGTITALMGFAPVSAFANYYSEGSTSSGGSGGGYAQAQIEDMYAPDCPSGGHTNQTLWTST